MCQQTTNCLYMTANNSSMFLPKKKNGKKLNYEKLKMWGKGATPKIGNIPKLSFDSPHKSKSKSNLAIVSIINQLLVICHQE